MVIHIRDGKHEGELGVIINTSNNIHEVLTLEGDIHYYTLDSKEVIKGDYK